MTTDEPVPIDDWRVRNTFRRLAGKPYKHSNQFTFPPKAIMSREEITVLEKQIIECPVCQSGNRIIPGSPCGFCERKPNAK